MKELNVRHAFEQVVAETLTAYGITIARAEDDGSDVRVCVPTAEGLTELTLALENAPARRSRRSTGGIVAHQHVSERLASLYREEGQFYVDAAGNAFIDLPGFVIDVRGRGARPRPRTTSKAARTFGASGARIVFVLLVEPAAVGCTVRELGRLGGVSVGTVSSTLRLLEDDGFLARDGTSRSLVRVGQLTDHWLASYLTRVAPTLDEAALTGPGPRWWIDAELPATSCLGGGVALAAMGVELDPASTLVYGSPPWDDLRSLGRLRRAEGVANVALREQFWAPELNPRPGLAPALITYADAVTSGDPRVAAAAKEMWASRDDLRRH